jgi:hypothetical protein
MEWKLEEGPIRCIECRVYFGQRHVMEALLSDFEMKWSREDSDPGQPRDDVVVGPAVRAMI